MKGSFRWHGVAGVGSALALVGAAAALSSGALAAGAVHKCADKTVTIEIPGPTGTTKIKEPIKAISTQGTTCAAAYEFIAKQLNNTTGVTPGNYKCKTGKFTVPVGYVPIACTRGKSTIKYAEHGG